MMGNAEGRTEVSEGIELPPLDVKHSDMDAADGEYLGVPNNSLERAEALHRVISDRLCRERQLRDALKQLHVVLEREAATTARYDAKVAELESQQAADREELRVTKWRVVNKFMGLEYCPVFDTEEEAVRNFNRHFPNDIRIERLDTTITVVKELPAAAEGGR